MFARILTRRAMPVQPVLGVDLERQSRNGRWRIAQPRVFHAQQVATEENVFFQIDLSFRTVLNHFPAPRTEELASLKKREMRESIAKRKLVARFGHHDWKRLR